MDEEIRRLERLAARGDAEAEQRLTVYYRRMGGELPVPAPVFDLEEALRQDGFEISMLHAAGSRSPDDIVAIRNELILVTRHWNNEISASVDADRGPAHMFSAPLPWDEEMYQELWQQIGEILNIPRTPQERNPIFSRGTSFSKTPERTLGTAELAKHLQVNQETVRRWARTSDIPHDVIIGERAAEQVNKGTIRLEDIARKIIKYDPEEVRFWYMSQTAAGKRLPRRNKIPLAEGRARLQAVKKRLDISTQQLATALSMKRTTLNGYLYGNKQGKLNSIPMSIVTMAEGLTEDDIPVSSKHLPKHILKNALIINRGRIYDTARALEMHPTTIKKRVEEYGLKRLLKRRPRERISREDLMERLISRRGHVKEVAGDLKIERSSLYKLLNLYGLDPKEFRSFSKIIVYQYLKKHHGNRTDAAGELGIGVEGLRQLVRKYGLEKYFPTGESKLRPAKVGRMYAASRYNVEKTAKHFGVSVSYMNKYLNRFSLRPPLDPEEVRLYFKSRRGGARTLKTARKFGLSVPYMTRFLEKYNIQPKRKTRDL